MPESYCDTLIPAYHPASVTIQEYLPAAMYIDLKIKMQEKVISIETERCFINIITIWHRKLISGESSKY